MGDCRECEYGTVGKSNGLTRMAGTEAVGWSTAMASSVLMMAGEGQAGGTWSLPAELGD